ncbi:MAG: redoxin domain-containing protein [Flavobacterium sp.]|nr:redoxin domain-containing protein [Flavobacterium sp.]PZO35038.1 MAG: hypothetical protein DCE86_00085 [Flavobacteriaceae bacterium]
MSDKIINIKLVLSAFFFLSFGLYAQEKGKSVITGTYTGENNGLAILATANRYVYLRNNLDFVEDTVSFKNNTFRFEIANQKQPIYFTLFVPFKSHRGQKLYMYTLAPDSDIQIDLRADTVVFKGRGSETLTCQYLIGKVNRANGVYKPIFKSPEVQDSLLNKWGDYEYKLFTKKNYDSVYNEKFKLLQGYKSKISPLTFQWLWTDLESEKDYSIYNSFFGYSFYSYPAEKQQALLKFYKDQLFDRKADTTDLENKIETKLYTTAIIAKLEADIIFENIPRIYRSAKVDSLLYLRIINEFDSRLRERLLTDFMIKVFKKGSKSLNYYYTEILSIVKDSYLSSILSTYQGNIKGRPAYPFVLPNLNGDLFSLKQFKGKLLLIDFWFKGCSQCISLEEQMRPVRQHFKNNTNIVFLSINVDYKKETWLDGIASGKYTDAQNINLSLHGLGFKHPFLRYYGYLGFPQLLIIDRTQKVLNAQPARPFIESDRPKFIKYLESLL